MIFYIDNIFIARNNNQYIQLKKSMIGTFKMMVLGNAKYYLRI